MKNNLKVKEKEIINDEKIENKKIIKPKKTQKNIIPENYDHFYGITKNLRENIIQPPKNTLSELVFNNNYKELEKQLKTNKYNPDSRDEKGETYSWTPLYWAVKYNKIDCAKVLLRHGATISMVINDLDECCGTVLDLATMRSDEKMEILLREFAEKEEINLGQSFKAIRTKLRGKAPAFNFTYYGKKKEENQS